MTTDNWKRIEQKGQFFDERSSRVERNVVCSPLSKRQIIMKKLYLTPATEVTSVEVTNMLAESLPISADTVNGGDALTKENSWDIWGDK